MTIRTVGHLSSGRSRFVLIAIFALFDAGAALADEIDSGHQLAPAGISAQLGVFASQVEEALACLPSLKNTGTVWLRTEKMHSALASAAKKHADANDQANLAKQVLSDCSMIKNQQELERARYLLTTINKSSENQEQRNAVRAMLLAADGEAALALVLDLIGK
ncbi:MAG: hypothetical protein AAF387_07920 [Pseudomonadota bacterium]